MAINKTCLKKCSYFLKLLQDIQTLYQLSSNPDEQTGSPTDSTDKSSY